MCFIASLFQCLPQKWRELFVRLDTEYVGRNSTNCQAWLDTDFNTDIMVAILELPFEAKCPLQPFCFWNFLSDPQFCSDELRSSFLWNLQFYLAQLKTHSAIIFPKKCSAFIKTYFLFPLKTHADIVHENVSDNLFFPANSNNNVLSIKIQ